MCKYEFSLYQFCILLLQNEFRNIKQHGATLVFCVVMVTASVRR